MEHPRTEATEPRPETLLSLVRAYRMYQAMMAYPKLVGDMRRLFLGALEERGITTKGDLRRRARESLDADGLPVTEAALSERENIILDLLFANHFTPDDIENYVNLARKRERFRILHKVVNTEGVTSRKIKQALKDFCEIPQGDLYISPDEAEGVRVALINHFISNQLPLIGIAKQHITIRDIDEMLDNTYWSRRRPGKIGGKAAGMLLAYKILVPRLKERDSELEKFVTIPESYYFNSGIFSDFLDHNELYHFHSQKYKTRDMIEEEYRHISELFRKSSFPPDVLHDVRSFLEKVGEAPLILRSSSLLEDNFGYAFSGKYDSVFIANRGDIETRMQEFVWGLKQVHMSTFGPSPILYRRDHNLLDFDEKMSVLVQKVVGQQFGDSFFPFAAGVAFSYNSFAWTPRIRKGDGLVRLVLGLGTRAVDRVGGDYPRMIPLSHPTLRPEIDADQIAKYSQKSVDVLNVRTGHLETRPVRDLLREVNHPDIHMAVSIEEDGHLAAPMFRGRSIPAERSVVTFDNFLTRSPFVPLMRKILRGLEEAYGRPVDVEFAWNGGKLYLLQCRALSVRDETDAVRLPRDIPPEQVLFTNDRGVSTGAIHNIEYIVYVDPRAYAAIPHQAEKLTVGRVVSRVNQILTGKRYALFGPGRWGSNDIALGVRVAYEDINRTLILGEIAFEEGGSTPEVSYGTHFFNDLVEARITPIGLYPDAPGVVLNEAFLTRSPNLLSSLDSSLAPFEHVVRVIHVPSATGGRFLQVCQNGPEQKGMGFFATGSEESGWQ